MGKLMRGTRVIATTGGGGNAEPAQSFLIEVPAGQKEITVQHNIFSKDNIEIEFWSNNPSSYYTFSEIEGNTLTIRVNELEEDVVVKIKIFEI